MCQGKITRHRKTKIGEENSILDYNILVCDVLKCYFEEMLIDDERINVLTKYVTTKGKRSKSESDHNLLFARFALSYQKAKKKTKMRFSISKCGMPTISFE